MDGALHPLSSPAPAPVDAEVLRLPVPLPPGLADTLGQALCRSLPASVRRRRHAVTDLPTARAPGCQQLTLHIETDGSQSPRAALLEAAWGLQVQLGPLAEAGRRLQPVAQVIACPDPVLTAPIARLGLGQRGLNALHGRGITTVGDLLACTATDLLQTPNFGRRCLHELQQALADWGLVRGALAPAAPGRGARGR